MSSTAEDASFDPAVKPKPAVATDAGRRIRLWPAMLISLGGIVATAASIVLMSRGEQNWTAMYASFLTPWVTGLFLLGWWVFASRARWRSKLLLVVLFVVLSAAMAFLIERQLMMTYAIFAAPVAAIVGVAWWGVTGWLGIGPRRAGLIAVCILAFGAWLLLRSEGASGAAAPMITWRWQPTAEQIFLATRDEEPAKAAPAAIEPLPETAEWPGFRGPNRDSRVSEANLSGDWRETPPEERWRRRLGPAWSSMAVAGKRLFTQEQRGPQEAVVCYNADTGAELWKRLDKVRFEDAQGGPGPRATPTYHQGRIYAFGATGLLSSLDAGTGKLIWRRDVAQDYTLTTPVWGFSSSPLVLGDYVYVLGGGDGKALLAYDWKSGDAAWSSGAGGTGTMGYSSPQLATFGDENQILVLNEVGLAAFDAVSGKPAWVEKLTANNQATLQPQIFGANSVLVGLQYGVRRYAIERTNDDRNVKLEWTAKRLQPSFNDIVVCGERGFGIDGALLVCIDLGTGNLLWKGGRYGRGQLLMAGNRLIVQAESGDVALVDAIADKHVELGRIAALSGKTWNHPALAGHRLFVRNGEEMACYELP